MVFYKKFVRKTFAIFTGKHICWSLFSIKLQANFIKKRLQHRCFPMNIAKSLRTPFLKNILQTALLRVNLLIYFKPVVFFFNHGLIQKEKVDIHEEKGAKISILPKR